MPMGGTLDVWVLVAILFINLLAMAVGIRFLVNRDMLTAWSESQETVVWLGVIWAAVDVCPSALFLGCAPLSGAVPKGSAPCPARRVCAVCPRCTARCHPSGQPRQLTSRPAELMRCCADTYSCGTAAHGCSSCGCPSSSRSPRRSCALRRSACLSATRGASDDVPRSSRPQSAVHASVPPVPVG